MLLVNERSAEGALTARIQVAVLTMFLKKINELTYNTRPSMVIAKAMSYYIVQRSRTHARLGLTNLRRRKR